MSTQQGTLSVDLHVHSRFAMATSPALDIPALAEAARLKGIDVLATGDFTHPVWLSELRDELSECEDGVFASSSGGKFILGAEISCVWKQDGRGRRVHLLLLAPDFAAVDVLVRQFAKVARLASDGRPILKLSASEAARIAWDADERCVVIPAHAWTPWYGLLGSKSGFDSIEECFGEDATRIKAIETGLSSDPSMNWRVPGLDSVSIVSFSDAHSAALIGREITILDATPSYTDIVAALTGGGVNETVEFFPEHGKYHLNGHRKCNVCLQPKDTPPDGRCEVCGRPLTVGVMDRVEELAKRPDSAVATDGGLICGPAGRPPYRRLVPLADLLSRALNVGRATKTVERSRTALIHEFGTEFATLLDATRDEIGRVAGENVASAVLAMRRGEISIRPGFDGEYGQIILPQA